MKREIYRLLTNTSRCLGRRPQRPHVRQTLMFKLKSLTVAQKKHNKSAAHLQLLKGPREPKGPPPCRELDHKLSEESETYTDVFYKSMNKA